MLADLTWGSRAVICTCSSKEIHCTVNPLLLRKCHWPQSRVTCKFFHCGMTSNSLFLCLCVRVCLHVCGRLFAFCQHQQSWALLGWMGESVRKLLAKCQDILRPRVCVDVNTYRAEQVLSWAEAQFFLPPKIWLKEEVGQLQDDGWKRKNEKKRD